MVWINYVVRILSSQASIRVLADQVRSRFSRIDVLINNAGAIFARRELSIDGIEKTFAINHLAPFLLTQLLFDLVRAAPAGRVITVASEIHSGSLDFDNLQGERSNIRYDVSYTQPRIHSSGFRRTGNKNGSIP